MSKQFTPCPACGAVGEVGCNCQFCGTAIILKEGAILSDARIVKQRTVTPQQYAEKISIYHNVVGLNAEVSKVCIGEQEGIINLNGDLIYPLGNERIKRFKDKIVQIGDKFFNLENFEFVKNPYYNKFVFEKIKLLSDAILSDSSEPGMIEIGFPIDAAGYYVGDTLCILNISRSPYANYYGLTPQLAIGFFPEFLTEEKAISRYERIKSCDDYKLFETMDTDIDGSTIPTPYRIRYILCGNNAQRCGEIALRVLAQAFDILPEDAPNHMECSNEGVFQDKKTSTNTIESTNSGCAGMFAFMLSIGAASVYGLIELIGSLIA